MSAHVHDLEPLDDAALRAKSIRQLQRVWPALLDAIEPMLAEMAAEREIAAVASAVESERFRRADNLRACLDQAFDQLEGLGFATSRGAEFSGSFCVAVLKSPFAYWHAQDEERHADGKTLIGWSGDAAAIIAELQRAGLTIEWDGSPDTRLLAKLRSVDPAPRAAA